MAFPPEIKFPRGHLARVGEDSARYLQRPGVNFKRPYIRIPDGAKFVFPVGTEGFSYSSNAALGIHRYIGKEDIEVNVIYRDEPHIELSGTLPGNTGPGLMRLLISILEADAPNNGKILFLPYIFPKIQFVAAESWRFDHDPSDRTRSIGYSISFIKVGVGRKIVVDPPEPGDDQGGSAHKKFTVKDGYRSLRKISKKVYGTEKKWHKIYRFNRKKIEDYFTEKDVPRHNFPTHRLPLGMKLKY